MTQNTALDILIRHDMWGLVRRACLTQAVQVIAPVVDEVAPNGTPLDTDALRSLIWSAKETLEAAGWDWSAKETLEAAGWDMSPDVTTDA